MKISSGLNGYQYPNRTAEAERKQEDAPQTGAASPTTRFSDALTGASTQLNGSLAGALWAMGAEHEASSISAAAAAPQAWVQNLYQEFA